MRRYISALMQDQRNTAADGLPKACLWLLSVLYGAVMRVRNLAYDRGWKPSYDVGVPVISVGNITMGGAGKTPLVVYIAREIIKAGGTPVVLLRGYMQKDRSSADSDEAELIRRKVPGVAVITGADRVERARAYLKEDQCDVFILDDAFQHRRIKRQLDIVAIDSLNPFGNGQVIPRGILREPLRGLGRADLAVATRCDLNAGALAQIENSVKQNGIQAPLIHTVHRAESFVNVHSGEKFPSDRFAAKSAVAFCGIGNPDGFRRTLNALQVDVRHFAAFPDHHRYTAGDFKVLAANKTGTHSDVFVTTLKDAVKLTAVEGFPLDQVYYLDIEIEVTHGQEEFTYRIHRVLRG